MIVVLGLLSLNIVIKKVVIIIRVIGVIICCIFLIWFIREFKKVVSVVKRKYFNIKKINVYMNVVSGILLNLR